MNRIDRVAPYNFVAIKQLDLKKIPIKKIEQEVDLVQKLDHPHIIKYLSTSYSGSNYYIKMEYMGGGSVKSMLQKIMKSERSYFGFKYPKLSYFLIQKYSVQILSALAYLHESNHQRKAIIHRDIKCSNILLKDEDNVVLSDFGESIQLKDELPSSNIPEDTDEPIGGTLMFM